MNARDAMAAIAEVERAGRRGMHAPIEVHVSRFLPVGLAYRFRDPFTGHEVIAMHPDVKAEIESDLDFQKLKREVNAEIKRMFANLRRELGYPSRTREFNREVFLRHQDFIRVPNGGVVNFGSIA